MIDMKMVSRIVRTLSAFLAFSSLAFSDVPLSDQGSISVTTLPSQPAEISRIQVNGETIVPNQPFPVNSGWLSTLKVQIKNISQGTITFTELKLSFPSNSAGLAVLPQMTISVGKNTLIPPSVAQPAAELHLAPGETADLVLSASMINVTEADIQSSGISLAVASRLSISFTNIGFDNDTVWHLGAMAVRDPTNPRHWIRATPLSTRVSPAILTPRASKVKYVPGRDSFSIGRKFVPATDTVPAIQTLFVPGRDAIPSVRTKALPMAAAAPFAWCKQWDTLDIVECAAYCWRIFDVAINVTNGYNMKTTTDRCTYGGEVCNPTPIDFPEVNYESPCTIAQDRPADRRDYSNSSVLLSPIKLRSSTKKR